MIHSSKNRIHISKKASCQVCESRLTFCFVWEEMHEIDLNRGHQFDLSFPFHFQNEREQIMTTNVWLTQVSLINAQGPSASITNRFNPDQSRLFYSASPELGLNHIPSVLPQSGTNRLCNCASFQ